MSISERLLQYLDYKGISKTSFYKSTGFSNGYLDKKPNFGADKIERIVEVYTDLSLNWLITGTGDMLVLEEETSPFKVEDYKSDYKTEERALKPNEIISKLVLQNETLIAIIDRHSSIIEKLSSHF